MEPKNALGKTCRDIVLNTQGICTKIIDFLYGCRTYCLEQPRGQEGNAAKNSVSVQEACLEIIDDTTANVPLNEYYAPTLLGHEVLDKVTKRKGICVMRIFPFIGSPQYCIESIPNDPDKEPVMYCLDEGRLTVIEDSPNSISLDEVQGKHKGGASFVCAPQIVTL